MKPRLLIPLLLLVLLPLGLLLLASYRLEQSAKQQRLALAAESCAMHLDRVASEVQAYLEYKQRTTLGLLEALPLDTDSIRKAERRTSGLGAIFVISPEGALVHPPPNPMPRELDFLRRTASIWDGDRRFFDPAQEFSRPEPITPMPESAGWHSWFHGNGAQFLLWQRRLDGTVIGVEINRADMLSDLIADLPDTLEKGIEITDASGRPLYRSSQYIDAPDTPGCMDSLPHPLEMWEVMVQDPPPKEKETMWSFSHLLILSSLLLAGVGFYIYRETTRDMREAFEKVSFVNQVSHELKTPLTNIRMYAELLEERIPEEDPFAQEHLGVVVSESQRLSRLINNVLTFARQNREGIRLKLAQHTPNDDIQAVIEQFRPAFLARGITPSFSGSTDKPVMIDQDILTQILGNLLSNVEKYAASGKRVEITSDFSTPETTRIQVRDYGPGIQAAQSGRIFDPFVRLSNKVSEGASGTGIGLTIVRDLVRLHGGEIRFSDAAPGCRFEFTLHTPLINSEDTAI